MPDREKQLDIWFSQEDTDNVKTSVRVKRHLYSGESDYQTGLAAAMDTMGTYSVAFADTEEYKWLTDNAWKFGFILRYPADKADITGHTFEPWHYRYVGRYHAKIIRDNGLCLEEYIARISN